MIKEFRTQDLQLAVHLRLCDVELEKIERSQYTKRATFVFSEDEEKIKQIIQSFWEKTKLFPTLEVMSIMAELKRRLYQG